MSVSEQEFSDWLETDNRRAVWSLELHGFDSNGVAHVVYVCDRDFMHPDFTFYGMMSTPEIAAGVTPFGSANFTEIGIGLIQLNDIESDLAEWRTYRHTDAIVRLGDRAWPHDDHRVMLSATVTDWTNSGRVDELVLSDLTRNADTVIAYNDISVTSGTPGNVVRELLLATGAFSSGDIDVASFNALDQKFPFSVTIESFDNSQVALSIAENILAGLPADIGVSVLNHVEIVDIERPVIANALAVTAVAEPEVISTLKPLGRVAVNNDAFGTIERTSDTVLALWGLQARELVVNSLINNAGDATTFADYILALFDQCVDRVSLVVDQANISLGQSVSFSVPRTAFSTTTYATVIRTEIAAQHVMELEVLVWR